LSSSGLPPQDRRIALRKELAEVAATANELSLPEGTVLIKQGLFDGLIDHPTKVGISGGRCDCAEVRMLLIGRPRLCV